MSGAAPHGSDEQVIDMPARSRFELAIGDLVAFAEYSRRPGVLTITHVETPPPLRGGGVAGRLMEGVLAFARDEGLKVTPLCSYAQVYIRRHPEYADLVGPD